MKDIFQKIKLYLFYTSNKYKIVKYRHQPKGWKAGNRPKWIEIRAA